MRNAPGKYGFTECLRVILNEVKDLSTDRGLRFFAPLRMTAAASVPMDRLKAELRTGSLKVYPEKGFRGYNLNRVHFIHPESRIASNTVFGASSSMQKGSRSHSFR